MTFFTLNPRDSFGARSLLLKVGKSDSPLNAKNRRDGTSQEVLDHGTLSIVSELTLLLLPYA